MDNLQLILDSIPGAVCAVRDDVVVAANTAFLQLLGLVSDTGPVKNITDNAVFVRYSANLAEIDGIVFTLALNLCDGVELFAVADASERDAFTRRLQLVSYKLREAVAGAFTAVDNISGRPSVDNDDIAVRNVLVIRRYIAELLKLSGDVAEAMQPEDSDFVHSAFDLAELCNDMLATVSLLLTINGADDNPTLKFSNKCGDEPTRIWASASKLERMLINLITDGIERLGRDCSVLLTLENIGNCFILTLIVGAKNEPNRQHREETGMLESAFDSKMKQEASFSFDAAMRIARLHGGSILTAEHNNTIECTIRLPKSKPPLYAYENSDFYVEDPMRRILIGLSEILDASRFGAPFYSPV